MTQHDDQRQPDTPIRPTTAEVMSISGNHRIQRPIERRTSRRVMVDLFVQENDGTRVWMHPATNLSASGIFIESHSFSLRNAQEQPVIDMQFQLPDDSPPIRTHGQVMGSRRVRGFARGLAVRFVDLSDIDRERLTAFIERRLAAGDDEGPENTAAPT